MYLKKDLIQLFGMFFFIKNNKFKIFLETVWNTIYFTNLQGNIHIAF